MSRLTQRYVIGFYVIFAHEIQREAKSLYQEKNEKLRLTQDIAFRKITLIREIQTLLWQTANVIFPFAVCRVRDLASLVLNLSSQKMSKMFN